jgi:hypothetical protein
MTGVVCDLKSRQDSRERVLICRTCNRCIHCTPEDLLSYMRKGWPKCCDETMPLSIKTRLPT